MSYTYACSEYPGMESCPGRFTAETLDELWKHVELHGALAHDENSDEWSDEERQTIRDLIREA